MAKVTVVVKEDVRQGDWSEVHAAEADGFLVGTLYAEAGGGGGVLTAKVKTGGKELYVGASVDFSNGKGTRHNTFTVPVKMGDGLVIAGHTDFGVVKSTVCLITP